MTGTGVEISISPGEMITEMTATTDSSKGGSSKGIKMAATRTEEETTIEKAREVEITEKRMIAIWTGS